MQRRQAPLMMNPFARLAGLLHVAAALKAEADGFLSAAAPGAAPGAAMAAPASSAVPDVAQTVGQRMSQDSARIGRVAENLMSVQGDINRVEKEVLGKVFDMQTMKNFFSTHQAALDENKRLTGEVSKLNSEISSVSTELANTRVRSEDLEKAHRQHITSMQAKVAEDEAVIQDLDAEMKHEKMLEQDNAKLLQINNGLREESSKAASQSKQVHYELTEAKATLQEHMKVTGLLQDQLIKQHEYAISCHDRVSTLETQLKATVQSQAAEKEATNTMIKQATSSTSAVQGQLLTENSQLKNMLEQAKQQATIYQNQLVKQHADMTSLQNEAEKELGTMRAELDKMREHMGVVEASLSTNINSRMIVENQLAQKEKMITSLQATLLDGKKAALISMNEQLRKDVERMQKALEISQVSEAQAKAQVMQAKQLMAVWKKAAAQNAAAAQATAQEALQKVDAAKKSDEKAIAKADAAVMDAEASMLTQCSAVWDKKHGDILQKLNQCKTVKDDLKTVYAQVASLQGSLATDKATA